MSEQPKQNEPWYAWLFRQVVEKPAAVLAVVGWVAAGYLYADMRTFIENSTQAIQSLTQTIKLNNQEQCMKLEQILQNTRDLEYWHKHSATKSDKEQ